MTGVVVLMTGLVALSLIATNPHEARSSVVTVARAPASLVSNVLAPEKPTPLVERTAVLNMPCRWRPETQLEPGVKHVRIRGKLCGKDEPLQSSEIINTANGFRATVFHPGAYAFTSDYIHLSEGKNRLVFTHVLSTGEKLSREMTLIRSN